MPVEIGAAKVALRREGMVRIGSIPLRNRTARAVNLRVEVDPRLGAPASLNLAPNGTAVLLLKTRPDDFAAVRENVKIGGQTVEVAAGPVPPDLRAKLGQSDGRTWPVTLENEGAPAAVQVSAEGGFQISAPDRAFTLGHGETRAVEVRPAGTDPGKLIAVAGTDRVELPLKQPSAPLPLTPVSDSADC